MRLKGAAAVLMIVASMSLPVESLAVIGPNQVVSSSIRPADGTSGQDVTVGTGIKRGHIQDAAVTGSKIADGAVTDTKITGPISASKIQDGVFQKKTGNVITVAKTGGDFTALLPALQSITDASETNPYIIKIMPGVYDLDLAAATIVVNPFVTIEGSGENATFLVANSGWGDMSLTNAEIRGLTINIPSGHIRIWGSRSLFRNVTVNSTDKFEYHALWLYGDGFTFDRVLAKGGLYNAGNLVVDNSRIEGTPKLVDWTGGIFNEGNATLTVRNTVIDVTDSNTLTHYGIRLNYGSGNVVISNSSINVNVPSNGYGVIAVNGNIQISSSQIKVPQGIAGLQSIEASVFVDNSEITGMRSAISGGGSFKIGSTKVNGPFDLQGLTATFKCINSYDGDYNQLVCP
ncbi:right-handed parallel beta-helix repeat-containing protein [Geotalea toluenoxydans]|uniref:right-handed parallel beta-helix repeat-containing protein n=1 Tax=Geotalea toluenoxydans TaxID=421624 RepID=UPI0006D28E8A|nr:right-handed parallel beta-helix repeat-containing protein [Geotalea toluenoxydans]